MESLEVAEMDGIPAMETAAPYAREGDMEGLVLIIVTTTGALPFPVALIRVDLPMMTQCIQSMWELQEVGLMTLLMETAPPCPYPAAVDCLIWWSIIPPAKPWRRRTEK